MVTGFSSEKSKGRGSCSSRSNANLALDAPLPDEHSFLWASKQTTDVMAFQGVCKIYLFIYLFIL